jgi:hypothetical protein
MIIRYITKLSKKPSSIKLPLNPPGGTFDNQILKHPPWGPDSYRDGGKRPQLKQPIAVSLKNRK